MNIISFKRKFDEEPFVRKFMYRWQTCRTSNAIAAGPDCEAGWQEHPNKTKSKSPKKQNITTTIIPVMWGNVVMRAYGGGPDPTWARLLLSPPLFVSDTPLSGSNCALKKFLSPYFCQVGHTDFTSNLLF